MLSSSPDEDDNIRKNDPHGNHGYHSREGEGLILVAILFGRQNGYQTNELVSQRLESIFGLQLDSTSLVFEVETYVTV